MRSLTLAAALLVAGLARAEYKEGPVTGGGTVTGKVSYDGAVPAPKKLTVTKDPKVCGASQPDEAWLVASDGGVENVVVYLADIKAGKKLDGDMKPIVDQKACRYTPHLQVIPVHADLQFKNSDSILHNVHVFLGGSTVYNGAMPTKDKMLSKKMDKAGGMKLKCDVHSFMRGGVFVAENPYFAVTGKDGSFSISDVPPGTYKIMTWHEEAAPKTGSVTVAANGSAKWDVKVK